MSARKVRLPAEIRADDRFIMCFNPQAAERDRAVREELVTLGELIEGSDRLLATKRAEFAGRSRPG